MEQSTCQRTRLYCGERVNNTGTFMYMVHRGDLRSGGDHLLPLLHDQGGGHVGLLGDGVGGQPPLLADLQERLVGVGVGDGVRALAARDLALEPLDWRRLLGRRGLGLGLGRRAAAVVKTLVLREMCGGVRNWILVSFLSLYYARLAIVLR